MAVPVVSLSGVSKRFFIDSRPRTILNLFRRIVSRRFLCRRTVWALREVTMTVSAGEWIGVVGANASGKSTLLRLIAGIYRPTVGTLSVTGAIAAFLRLGVPLEMNLTVEENIHLFATVMGISRARIRERLPEILSFAELQDFRYCPVRDISSGMLQRLQFSVLRLTEADIYLLDEVTGNADLRFQKKCVQVLKQFSDAGKAGIIVTHDLSLIGHVCQRVLIFDQGRGVSDGPAAKVLREYQASGEA